jgi:hypothetical protein
MVIHDLKHPVESLTTRLATIDKILHGIEEP